MTKILIATGGTGGHIYPALVTAQELRRRGVEAVFIGTFGAAQEKIKDAGFEHVSISAQGFVSRGVFQKAAAVGAMAPAIIRCMGAVRRLRPDVILGFGGYSSFPTALAGILCGTPTMLHEQNAFPGQANKLLGKFVRRIAVGFKDAMTCFPSNKTVWTGNPLRPFDRSITREAAHTELGLDPLKSTILVFGGSQGSRAINGCVVDVFSDIPQGIDLQVIHITGKNDFSKVKDRYAVLGVKAFVREYMDRMALAYAAADLVVGRSGAGTVTELGLLGVPAVLIPYPGAMDHQKYNARVLERLGTASIIEEKCLRQDILRDKIFSQLKRDPSGSMRIKHRENLKGDFVHDGAERLCDEVLTLIHE
jgi:UDP-N-acetylglucosamine--N-acetylmuramyl-(pentapeptide) pyrophosphoryl-undecaprenol N-acetylglucosamine transferase